MNQIQYHLLWNDDNPPLVTKEEMRTLLKLININQDRINVAVELGSYAGGTSVNIAKNLKEGAVLYCVDNFSLNRSHIRKHTVDVLFPQFPNIILLEMSTQAAALQLNKVIDFLFIDADHQDDSIWRDCASWLPRVRSGGIVAFHDYFNPDFPSVARRVDEFTPGWLLVQDVDSLRVLLKP